MGRSRAIRARLAGLLLAAVFAAANLGLPAADALLDHRVGSPSQSTQSHFEGLNGCREHVDHCPLGRMLGAVRLQTPGKSPAPFAPAAHRPFVPSESPSAPTGWHHTSYLLRAPPQHA